MLNEHELQQLSLLAPRVAPDGKAIVSLEDYLGMQLKHPTTQQETLRLNCAGILRLLGVMTMNSNDGLLKRTAKWLRVNGYRSASRGKMFKVALVHPSSCPYHVV
jgi:hypothetical protein